MEAMVGRSGNARDFLAVVTANALTLPLLRNGCAASAVANSKSTSPLTSAAIAGPPPLYGMCVTLTPANCFSISIDRWLVVPLPLDPAFILPLFLAMAMSSLTFLAGTLGCATSTSGTEDIQLTGTRSLNGS